MFENDFLTDILQAHVKPTISRIKRSKTSSSVPAFICVMILGKTIDMGPSHMSVRRFLHTIVECQMGIIIHGEVIGDNGFLDAAYGSVQGGDIGLHLADANAMTFEVTVDLKVWEDKQAMKESKSTIRVDQITLQVPLRELLNLYDRIYAKAKAAFVKTTDDVDLSPISKPTDHASPLLSEKSWPALVTSEAPESDRSSTLEYIDALKKEEHDGVMPIEASTKEQKATDDVSAADSNPQQRTKIKIPIGKLRK
jgi:hypothetical protein